MHQKLVDDYLHGPKIRAPSLDFNGPKIGGGLDIHGPKICAPSLDVDINAPKIGSGYSWT